MSKKKVHVEIPFLLPAEHPQVAEYFLPRPALDSLLVKAFEKSLTLVIASAGYGKTQAVLAALKAARYPFAWVQFSDLDNLTYRFWEHFSGALKAPGHNLFDMPLSSEYPESLAAFDRFLQQLAGNLPRSHPFVLVFDDFHHIENKTVLKFFKLLISVRLPNLAVVLISRTLPTLSLSKVMSQGMLTFVTMNELRFSKNEMIAYFHNRGADLSARLYWDIYAYTDGWIFAIYLVGLSLAKTVTSFQNPFLEAKINIYDLLEKELFEPASAKLQHFMIKLSLLDSLPDGLFKSLIRDDTALISELKKSYLLLRYDSLSDRYYFQPLFRDYLLAQKARLTTAEISGIHLTAAKWYLHNNCRIDALIHYQECGCYDQSFDIIMSFNYHVAPETADLFIRLIEQAPTEILDRRPVMQIVKCYFMFNNNRLDEVHQELQKLSREYRHLPKTAARLAVLGEAYIVLGLINIVRLDYEFEAFFKLADECLPQGSKLINANLNITDGLNFCSIKDPSPGSLKRHQDALFNIAPYAFRVMNGCGCGIEYLNCAEASLYTGNLKEAEKNAYEAIYRSRQHQQYGLEYMACFVLVRILTAKGRYPQIADILAQLQHRLKTIPASGCITLNDIISSWFFVKIGKSGRAANWIKSADGITQTFAPVVLGREYLVRSEYLLAENRYYELLAFMGQTDRLYQSRGILFAVIQNKITRAIINHTLGLHDESMAALSEAYELAYPNNLVMQFIEYGNKMRTLIHTAKRRQDCNIPAAWLNNIYTKASSYAKQLTQIIADYDTAHPVISAPPIKLSKREAEVLLYLYRGLTRAEIAASCYLSLSTINSVIKNIYNKLGAANIADAVRIARRNNLI